MHFTESHEWVAVDPSGVAAIGITEHAQRELGDIVFVELPPIGKKIQAGDEAAVLESTKSAIDIYAPVSGEVVEINASLLQQPEKINLSAQNEGWLFKVRLADRSELNALLDRNAYEEMMR
jgi:glycine cleavage system H protein